MSTSAQTAKLLLDAIIYASTPQERKEAKKAWRTYLDSIKGDLPQDVAEVLLAHMRNPKSITSHTGLASFISALWLPFLMLSHRSVEGYRACADFTLRMLEHEKGTVREAIRHTAHWLRWPEVGRSKTELTKEYFTFIAQLETHITRYKPQHITKRLEEMPSSVYKSLVHAWYDFAPYTRDTIKEWVQKAHEKGYPTLDSFYLAEEDKSTYDIDELAEHLWDANNSGDWKQARHDMQGLQEWSIQVLESVLRSLHFEEYEIQSIFATTSAYGKDALGDMFPDLLFRTMERNNFPTLDHTAELTRAFQSYTDHHLFELKNSKPMSYFLWDTAQTRTEYNRNVPRDWGAFLTLTKEAHEAIEQYFQVIHDEAERGIQEFLARLDERERREDVVKRICDSHTEHLQLTKNIHRQVASIAHYALDRYLQAEPWSAYRKTPKQLAAHSHYFTSEFNMEHKRYSYMPSSSELSRFAGWKSASALSSARYSFRSGVLFEMSNQTLLLLPKQLEE